jgi:hypothetical protein
MIDPTLELLINKIAERRKEVLGSIAEGSAKDYAHYQSAVGYIRACDTIQGIIADIVDRMENSDE